MMTLKSGYWDNGMVIVKMDKNKKKNTVMFCNKKK
jgi:hypothetical protein